MKQWFWFPLMLMSLNLQAVNYVSSPPLDQALTLKVKNCSAKKTWDLPLITWGGDIATILANGSRVTTAPGSAFHEKGLDFRLVRVDEFKKQIESLMNCDTPYLRGTMGMIQMANKLLAKDKRTQLRVIYQHTWSQGGDALVVKSKIRSPKDLKGKTIAVQAYGPHVDYLAKLLSNSGISLSDVKLKWVKDLTGSKETPMAAFYEKDIDAAMVIIPDALALTSNGTVGTGAEDSVKGSRILLSTKSANRIIADVYAVREDFYQSNQKKVGDFVHALLQSQERLAGIVDKKAGNLKAYNEVFKASAKILLDSEAALADTQGLYADASFVGFKGNQDYFATKSYPRNFEKLSREIAQSLAPQKLVDPTSKLNKANWDYKKLKAGIVNATLGQDKPAFDKKAVAKVVERKNRRGSIDDDSLFRFEVYFQPNQNTFDSNQYAEDFKRVIDLATTYGGAIITVEGHSDPLGFLKKKKAGESNVVLQRVRQSAKNLSMTRANSVRDALVSYAKKQNINLDDSQFAVVGHGISKPANGICGRDPCAPKTKEEWLNNMRVEFRMIQVEAEAEVFSPI